MIRVLLVDDQAVVRAGFRMFLDLADGIEVVGEAADGPEAVRLARRLAPDVVCMDVRMPGGNGLVATREITSGADGTHVPAVLVVTTFDLDEYVFGALEAGASGFVLKDTDPDDLVDAVRRLAAGHGMVDHTVTRRVITEFARRQPVGPVDAPESPLTPRELDIVRLLARGLSNAEIAEELVVETTTVKSHLGRAMAKIGVRDRLQVVVWAYRSGIADPGRNA
ncbi:response regulator transcription factor [Pseudonocardia nematodicida]|uniref:Response regulator transcription factor n=1 Tax=Pseudonocardia nematodicida TaxID=1206997 RepID=A0ABV1K5B8_9PSEU